MPESELSHRNTVFIFHGRCGSTLLQELLYKVEGCQIFGEPPPGENHFVDRLINRLEMIPDAEIETLLAAEYARYNFDPTRMVVSKHPNYAFIADMLPRIFPGCKMVCLERSVIDVIRSIAAAGWMENVRRQYIDAAPGIKAAMVNDFLARTGVDVPNNDMVWVGLYTAFRYAAARHKLMRAPAGSYVQVEFLAWMQDFAAESRRITDFLGLAPAVAERWAEQRYRAVQHTARAQRSEASAFGTIAKGESFRKSLYELPPEIVHYLDLLTELYASQDMPHSTDEEVADNQSTVSQLSSR